ncbi:hypothetical protein [Oscillatoria sp. HE19RPO]|uniref:hypothetical protein n=1 Tax=Oscillatoria sp. HE19RPO TaxID=2954806 RepID=UPI0020C54F93|nr:hypothetical protein [Oscillatoria sp. HE19RPO]
MKVLFFGVPLQNSLPDRELGILTGQDHPTSTIQIQAILNQKQAIAGVFSRQLLSTERRQKSPI